MGPPRLPTHLSHKSALVLLPPSSIAKPIEALRRKHDKHFDRWPPHINLIYPFLASPSVSVTRRDADDNLLHQGDHLKLEIQSRIRDVAKKVQPFRIQLAADPPGYFLHGKKSATVWLNPLDDVTGQESPSKVVAGKAGFEDDDDDANLDDSDPSSILSLASIEVKKLQAELQAEFAECDAETRPFRPHLSIGQAVLDNSIDKLSQEAAEIVRDFMQEKSEDAGQARPKIQDMSTSDEPSSARLSWNVDKVFVIERKSYTGRFKVVGVVELGEA